MLVLIPMNPVVVDVFEISDQAGLILRKIFSNFICFREMLQEGIYLIFRFCLGD